MPGHLVNVQAEIERRRLRREEMENSFIFNISQEAEIAAAKEQQNQTNTRVVAQGAAAQLAKEPSNKSFKNDLSQMLKNKKNNTNFSKLETTSGKAISANYKDPSTLSFKEKRAILVAHAEAMRKKLLHN